MTSTGSSHSTSGILSVQLDVFVTPKCTEVLHLCSKDNQPVGCICSIVRNNGFSDGVHVEQATFWTDPHEDKPVIEYEHPTKKVWLALVSWLVDVTLANIGDKIRLPETPFLHFRNPGQHDRSSAQIWGKVSYYAGSRKGVTSGRRHARSKAPVASECCLESGIRQRLE